MESCDLECVSRKKIMITETCINIGIALLGVGARAEKRQLASFAHWHLIGIYGISNTTTT